MASYTSVERNDLYAVPSLAPQRPQFKESTSSDPEIDSSKASRFDRRRRGIGAWTPLCIIGGTVVAAVLAILHHVFDSRLNAHTVSGFWTQTKSSQMEILIANAFKIVFCFSAGVSLCQVAWYAMRRQPLLLADIDRIVGEPSLLTLPRLNLIFQAPAALLITALILASPLITVFAPSLTVRPAAAFNRTLTVPTLNLTTDAVLDDIFIIGDDGLARYDGPSGTWDKIALAGLIAGGPVGWPIPPGCAPECQYNFTYFAPAVRCSDIAPDAIDDGASDGLRTVSRVFQDPPAAYLLDYDTIIANALETYIVNFTDTESAPDNQYQWTLAYLPFNAANNDNGTLINAAGSSCTFYNATHEAQTHFFNGTQESSVSVVEFHDPLDTSVTSDLHVFNENGNASAPLVGTPGVSFAPGLGGPLHFFAIADAISNRLTGEMYRSSAGVITTVTTVLIDTGIFESPDSFSQNIQRFPGLNISSSVVNVSEALQNLVANVTLGFVQMGTGNTTVRAVVPSTDTVYQYNRTTLLVTYAVSFISLLLISAAGMFCLVSNGEPSSNDFSQLLAATRNPKLDPVADRVDEDPGLSEKSSGQIRLMFGEVDVPGRGVKTAFGLVSEQKVEMRRRRG
ncbi:hypothetical protein C8R44DRAFT_981472 [Mycena epipterygia]|nr:hypothetical protein C8R44DRAFT_981472 [Mycena epipterygia]